MVMMTAHPTTPSSERVVIDSCGAETELSSVQSPRNHVVLRGWIPVRTERPKLVFIIGVQRQSKTLKGGYRGDGMRRDSCVIQVGQNVTYYFAQFSISTLEVSQVSVEEFVDGEGRRVMIHPEFQISQLACLCEFDDKALLRARVSGIKLRQNVMQ